MSPIGGLIRKKVIKTEEGEKTLKELKAGLQEKGLRLSFTVKGGQERSFIMSYYGLPTK
jgi:hypothetical protein